MSRAYVTMSKKEFRPRPIDVNQPLSIISDERILEEIDRETIPISSPLGIGRVVKKKSKVKNHQSAVATPLYREVQDKVASRFTRPQNYIVYQEDEEQENTDFGELEYELDHSDEQFLATLNGRIRDRHADSRQLRNRASGSSTPTKAQTPTKARREKVTATLDITDEMLEQLIDGLEKEAFFTHGLRQIRENTMDGHLCCVCNDHDDDEGDVLVLCDGCNMAAHQHCYGIHELPVAAWLCARCVCRQSNAVCVLCGGRYGGMKQTVDDQWAHVLCALWFPEVAFKDSFLRDPITGIDKIHSDRWNKVCSLCSGTRGVCISCDQEGCKTQFHVGCARAQGLFVEARPNVNTELKVILTAFCPTHSLHHLEHYPAFPRDIDRTLGNETALVAKSMGLADEDFDFIYRYWRVKRLNHPPPLLKTLRELTTEGLSVRVISMKQIEEERVRFVRLRQDFERARMLVDLVRRRELAKCQLLDSLNSLICFHVGEEEEEEQEEEEEEEAPEEDQQEEEEEQEEADTGHKRLRSHKRTRHKA